MSRCTYIRLVATQIWPLLRKAAQNNSSATFSTSTSGITIAASLPPSSSVTRFSVGAADSMTRRPVAVEPVKLILRSEEHTSELQSLMRISYAVFCLKKKKIPTQHKLTDNHK